MPHRSPSRQSPLPSRDGIDAAWIRFPDFSPWTTVGEAISVRYPAHWERFAQRLASGEVVDQGGLPVHEDTSLRRGMTLFYYRDLPVEDPVPFDITVLYQDCNIVVADKPHFLATMPRGQHVAETATVRLRRQFRLPELTPAHRLDRMTAGILLFTIHAGVRSAYQELFARHGVTKEYLAIAPHSPDLTFPLTRSSRIVKPRDAQRACEVQGEVNAITHIDLEEHDAVWGRYRLQPVTGRTHQLRVHMNALGIPIRGDNLFPNVTTVTPADYSKEPLQLLAQTLAFTDPITQLARRFVSERTLTGL
ncbi:pseudouridine synthase [Hoyosella altamirensis]|uniref:RNA pseudouridylate synthase n=1 Tax=Hoyosella altamirensis TaxID=616997 RepID=A0A839RM10_9ACTN|nr:pseudouridine synthase [Hoyosella altamirensis]MBB3037540.1 tRNA pseudouridine32 synthase/23S rRNA pseudouridine746 synthase [Hoyosella altamirensis]